MPTPGDTRKKGGEAAMQADLLPGRARGAWLFPLGAQM